MNGIERIAAERARQIKVEGWTPQHDAEHNGQELLAAADCYIATVFDDIPNYDPESYSVTHWPWDSSYWKPSTDPIRNLEKAGALIAAEIDRLLRGQSDE